MPQGGIEPGEDPHVAGKKWKKKAGTKNVEYLDEINSWLNYDIPSNLSEKLWNGKYRGQTQSGWLIGFLEKMMKLILKLKIQNLLIGNGKAIRIYLI